MRKLTKILLVFFLSLTLISCDKMSRDEGCRAVDLGLKTKDGRPLKWASCNVGANSPEEVGFYLAWGEVMEKERYGMDEYAYSVQIDDFTWDLSKYPSEGMTLEPKDDAATVVMGPDWRTPTEEELNILVTNVMLKWEFVSRVDKNENEVEGYLVTSMIPGYKGNSIFLPFHGHKSTTGRVLYEANGGCAYWSSKTSKKDAVNFRAHCLHLTKDNERATVSSYPRFFGIPIRAVTSE